MFFLLLLLLFSAYSICSNHTDLLAVHWVKQGHFHLRVFALAIPSTLNILSSSHHTEYFCTSSDLNSTVTSSECLFAENTTWCGTTSTNLLILLHFFFRALLTIWHSIMHPLNTSQWEHRCKRNENFIFMVWHVLQSS